MFQQIGLPAARVVHSINPRRNRDFERGRRAASAARKAGDSAMNAALAQIGETFNHAAKVNALKMRVEHSLWLGADHPAVRARYGKRAAFLRGRSINDAIEFVDQWCADARARTSWFSLDVLRELRLMLRLARRKLSDQQFQYIVGVVNGGEQQIAAE